MCNGLLYLITQMMISMMESYRKMMRKYLECSSNLWWKKLIPREGIDHQMFQLPNKLPNQSVRRIHLQVQLEKTQIKMFHQTISQAKFNKLLCRRTTSTPLQLITEAAVVDQVQESRHQLKSKALQIIILVLIKPHQMLIKLPH